MSVPAAPTDRPGEAARAALGVLWQYVDAARTHHVQAGVIDGPARAFFVRETGIGAEAGPAAEVFEERHALEAGWEMRALHAELEQRLHALGPYLKNVKGQPMWAPLRPPRGGPAFDCDPLPHELLGEDAELHFFARRDSEYAVLLFALPCGDARARYALFRLDLEFPDAAAGELRLLHPHLAPVVARSVLASCGFALVGRGFEKLTAVDRVAPANARWCAEMDAVVAKALARIEKGELGGQRPRLRVRPPPSDGTAPSTAPRALPPSGQPAGGGGGGGWGRGGGGGGGGGRGALGARVITQGAERPTLLPPPKGWKMPARIASDENPYQIEYDAPEREKEPLAPVAKIEENTLDFRTALAHPQILALHRAFLTVEEEAQALAAGELAVRAMMKAKRAAAPASEQHRLSIVEASLLVRYALAQPGRQVDAQSAELLRRALVYLA